MQVGKYKLINENKVARALDGNPNSGGQPTAKVVKQSDGSYDEAELLAYYDRLGGAIENKEGSRVKRGSFWDFVNNKPYEKPEVKLSFRINGQEVVVNEAEKMPEIVKAAQHLEKETKKLAKDKKKK